MRFLLIILLTSFFSFAQEKENELLKSYTFEEVTQLQKKEKRPVLIFIHTDWCKYCFAMKKNTFTNKKVIQTLNNKYYYISFNAENKNDIQFNSYNYKFKPTGNQTGYHELAQYLTNNQLVFPATIVLSNNNKVLMLENSFLSTNQLLKRLLNYSN